jgi:N-sulfoglucosamine sulfohydrolase
MIIRFPNKQQPGTKDDQLVSFIDFAPTLLSLTGINPPEYMQGQAFLGNYQAKEERKYIHGAADRFDGFTDAIRAVRNKQFKYIRNYRPEQEYYLPIVYRERIPTMQELLRLRDEGKLDSIQALWFRENKAPEEFYDCNIDPHELNNLVNDPAYNEKLEELRAEMDRWMEDIGDQPNLPERELISQLWGGKDMQPVTDKPDISVSDGKMTISCTTEGASLGYKIIENYGTRPKAWTVYQEPIIIPKDSKLLVQAHRIGFEPSEIIENRIVDLK